MIHSQLRLLCKLNKPADLPAKKEEVTGLKDAKTVEERMQVLQEHSDVLPQFKDRHDMQQSSLKRDLSGRTDQDASFAMVEGNKEMFDSATDVDKSFLKDVKTYGDLKKMSPQEKRVFYEDVLKVNLPKTKFSKRINAAYKEPQLVPLLTWQLYNWQYFTRKNRPTWVTHDGPAFTSGAPHLGLFYNKVCRMSNSLGSQRYHKQIQAPHGL